MRIRTTLLTGALLLASTLAMAQQTPQTPQPQGQTTDVVAPSMGNVDFGFRIGSFTGDEARFQRYQDIRDKGAGVNFNFNREGEGWFFNANANNVGYRDQAFAATVGQRKFKAAFEWNQTPLFYGSSSILQTPYSTAIAGNTAVLTLDANTLKTIQNQTTYTIDKTGTVTNAVQGATVGAVTAVGLATGGTVWRNFLVGQDVRTRRDDFKLDLSYEATRNVDVKFGVNSYAKNGTQPWGAAFGFNDAVELPLPIDNRTTNIVGDVEWSNQKGMFKVGYDGSFFHNNITTLDWSNPVRSTDSWNPSSYSNSLLGGSAFGRMALAPNNSANTFNMSGLYKLPGRSSLNASLAMSSLSQDDPLLPFTINSTLQPGAQVTLYTNGVATSTWTMVAPERLTAQADVRLTVGTINFQTRPNRYFGMTAKYRYQDWDNRTPIFSNQFNVRFDGAPENVPGSENEPASIKHNQFDADASFTPVSFAAFRVGYGYDKQDLTFRMFEATKESTFRVSMDTIGNQFVTLRAKFESSKREGEGLDTAYFPAAGQQPDMRQFDVANRDRKRTTLVLDVTPISVMGVSLSVFKGTDDYPAQQFGLLNNNNTGVNFGFDVAPTSQVSFGFNYGYEKYDASQASRNANPAPDPQFTDPTRNWNLNTNERVDTYGLNLSLVKLIPKTELRFGYDYSKSDQGFLYGGPRVDALAALPSAFGPQFQPLPNVGNKLQSATVDLKYFLSPKVAIGANFIHQKFDINDWQTSGPNGYAPYDPIGGLILGYGLRPYNANVGGVRVIYLF